ncbi:protein-arginine deiminase type-1-like [Parus major]|uniref:protein-arginine deiminase type-1-like n=1 Tax=Parus major TaxID=9157 RepID=UPI0008F4D036|nr:protein-arginine deiminase type-1-like [Parus major]
MAQQRRVQLSTQRPGSTVCVLGTELALDVCGSAPRGAAAFQAQATPGVKLWVLREARSVKLPSSVGRWPLAPRPELLLAMDAPSKDVGDEKVGHGSWRIPGFLLDHGITDGCWDSSGTDPKLHPHHPRRVWDIRNRSQTPSPPSQGLLEWPIFTDSVVFRVAPWIMTPNTAAPLEVFVCSVDNNEGFVAAVGALAERAQCPLTVCPAQQNRQDRWIQDEMEFGYVQAPHKTFPVVFDSPRDLGLKDFPIRSILGPDFGYVARQAPEGASSLDSFGNLEVSPPVTVAGKEYPLGRILIGSSFPRLGGRRMAKAVRDFLLAQKVQAPVELFSDWLHVGHVDEFLSFVPAPDRKGFRLLLASPSACYQLLKEKQEEGFGEAAMFQGLDRDGVPKPTINEILANEELRKFNEYAQVREGAGGSDPSLPPCPSCLWGQE